MREAESFLGITPKLEAAITRVAASFGKLLSELTPEKMARMTDHPLTLELVRNARELDRLAAKRLENQ
jgi:hypothetical protein